VKFANDLKVLKHLWTFCSYLCNLRDAEWNSGIVPL
jgi:hypothetical protein